MPDQATPGVAGMDKFIQHAFQNQNAQNSPMNMLQGMDSNQAQQFGQLVGEIGKMLKESDLTNPEVSGKMPGPPVGAGSVLPPGPIIPPQQAQPGQQPTVLPQALQWQVPGPMPTMKIPAMSVAAQGQGQPNQPFSVRHFETGTPNMFGVRTAG